MAVVHAAGTGVLGFELELAAKFERPVAKPVAHLVRSGDGFGVTLLGLGVRKQVELFVLRVESRYAHADEAYGVTFLPDFADKSLGDGNEDALVIDVCAQSLLGAAYRQVVKAQLERDRMTRKLLAP